MKLHPVLPRIDGSGAYCRAIRRALIDLGLPDMEARLWTRVYAYAARGVCWHHTIAKLARDYRVFADTIPNSLRPHFHQTRAGLIITPAGQDFLATSKQ